MSGDRAKPQAAAACGFAPPRGVAVLFALEREAAPFRRAVRGVPGVRVQVSGVGVQRARACAERVLADCPSLVVMAGFCGALRDGLPVGAVVIPAEVVDEHGGRWACRVSREPESAEASAAGCNLTPQPPSRSGKGEQAGGGQRPPRSLPPTCSPPRFGEGPGVGSRLPRLLTTSHLVATPADKRALAARFHADIVDMESAAVAAACGDRGVPFAAVRAVSDTAETALSPELVRLLAGGNVSAPKACAALLRKPSLLGEFLRLARDTKRAADTLAAELVSVVAQTATKM